MQNTLSEMNTISENRSMPYVEESLIKYLEKIFTDKCPEPSETDREIWMNRGAVGVIRHLKRLHQEQNENSLVGNI